MPVTRSASPPPAGEELPASKRARLDTNSTDASTGAFAKSSTLADSAPQLRDDFRESKPYLHAVAQNLFDTDLLKAVRKEIYDNLEFTMKETDIYRVYQTGDLANLDGLDASEASKLQNIRKLRDALYSPAFRAFLSEVTACGPLSGKQTDMSINDYRQGCHLLNHDDVIGTRRVSYILYLTDPDHPWSREDGGALELYPVVQKGTPANSPSKIIPVRFNQFTFFTVQPGHSFHSVEEVFTDARARLSISGWFHLPHKDEPGFQESRALLEREAETAEGPSLLQLKGKGDDVFTPVASFTETDVSAEAIALSETDISHLSPYLNAAYLSPTGISQLQSRFVDDSHVVLSKFISSTFATKLRNAIRVAEAASAFEGIPQHDACLEDGDWTIKGPPHRQRFLVPSGKYSTTATKLLAELAALATHPAFIKWLTMVTTLTISAHHITPRRFRPGLDYTLATSTETPLLELELSLTPSAGWDDGEIGGWECYMPAADEEGDDPAVYAAAKGEEDEEEGGALLTSYAGWNMMTVVMRDPGVLNFVKYVSAKAGESRWDLRGKYEFVDAGSDDGDEEEEEQKMLDV